MSELVEYSVNKASEKEIAEHLQYCDSDFLPPLSSRVDINSYANKIFIKSIRFEAWASNKLIGLVAVYCNDKDQLIAYITSVSVLKHWAGRGVAMHLLEQCRVQMVVLGMREINLEVERKNTLVIKLYKKCGYILSRMNTTSITMSLCLES